MTEPELAGDIALSIAHTTDIGGRQSNQDAFGVAQQDGLACFVVADGAGGHKGGEIASNVVVNAILAGFTQDLSFGIRALRSYVEHSIAEVAREKTTQADLQDMSTTVATVLIDRKNRCALWAHMGDTRVYLFRNRLINQVTKDHSMVQQFIDAGICKPEEARTHPQRSVLFAAIGAEGEQEPVVSDHALELEPGDAFLICSDGFWEWVSEAEMEASLGNAADVQQWINIMCAAAQANSADSAKARDNFTAIGIWLSN